MNISEYETAIQQAYKEVIERTNELLNLLAVYLNPSLFSYVRQQNIVRLRTIEEILKEAQTKPEYRKIYARERIQEEREDL